MTSILKIGVIPSFDLLPVVVRAVSAKNNKSRVWCNALFCARLRCQSLITVIVSTFSKSTNREEGEGHVGPSRSHADTSAMVVPRRNAEGVGEGFRPVCQPAWSLPQDFLSRSHLRRNP